MMEHIYLIAISVIILTCFYFIASSFIHFKEETAGAYNTKEEHLSLEDLYTAVNELEMDFLMKKVDKEDFMQLKDKYQLLAAKLMKQEIKQVTKSHNKIDESAELEIYYELEKIRRGKGRY